MLSEEPTLAPMRGASASAASQRIAWRRFSDCLSTKETVLKPSAKSWVITARKTSRPILVLRLKASPIPVSYTHLRAHETRHDLVCRLLLEKKKKKRHK